MTTKTIKTVLLGVLVAVMFVPVMGMNNALAEETPYTLDEIDHAFTAAQRGDYVSTDDDNVMTVEKTRMQIDGVDNDNIKIISEWAELHNGAMKVMESGDKDAGMEYYKFTQEGKFRNLTFMGVPTISHPDEKTDNGSINNVDFTVANESKITSISHPGQNYWSLTACGITYGSTQHSNPTIQIGVNGHANLASAQLALSNLGYTQLQTPYADAANVGYDYGKANYSGQGGCTGGEFRDQQFIYTSGNHIVGGVTYGPVHALLQVNEPNSNLAEYNAPTYWWDTYTYFWHLAN